MKTKVGIIGCGNISPRYFEACKRMDALELVGCADVMLERAQARAAEFNTQAFSVDQIIAHPDIKILINLTIPKAHGEIGLQAVNAGKSVYNEKPLAVTREQARALLDAAKAKGVLVGGAPDTFMGAGLQTCRADPNVRPVGRLLLLRVPPGALALPSLRHRAAS